MNTEKFIDKSVVVKQTGSSSKLTKRQLGTLVGLGLRGIGSKSELKCDNSVAGMIRKVAHVVEVELA